MGQGAALDFEDAAMLQRCLDEVGIVDYSKAFSLYEANRYERAIRVQVTSRSIAWLRDGKDLFWLYGYDVFTTPLVTPPGCLCQTQYPARLAGLLGYSWQDVITNRTVIIAGVDRPRAVICRPTARPPPSQQYFAELASATITATRGELRARFDRAMLVQGGVFTHKAKTAWAHDRNNGQAATATFQSLPARMPRSCRSATKWRDTMAGRWPPIFGGTPPLAMAAKASNT